MKNPTEDPNELPKLPITNQEETAFENPDVDPGFESSTQEQRSDDEGSSEAPNDQDALNYKNDRDNGAYNPNII